MSISESTPVQHDSAYATVSMLYLLITLGFFSWLLFDTWVQSHTLFRLLKYPLARLDDPLFHLVAYTVIGGAVGGIVNGIRSALLYHSSFNRRYIWKYIAAPWMGSALALIGFAILRSTVAIFGGNATGAETATPQLLANFGIGALAGYGAKDVFIWLDKQVGKLFAVTESTPDLTGKPQPSAESQIQAQNLSVGAVTTTPVNNGAEAGIVVDQAPAPGTPINRGDPVDIVVGTPANGDKDEPAPDKKGRRKPI